VDDAPPTTLVGLMIKEERVEVGVGVGLPAAEDCSKTKIAGLGSFCESATNFDGDMKYITTFPPVPELTVIVPLPFVGDPDTE
jgi:hypothetical protein